MFTGTVGSPLDCKFCGMSLCAWPGLSGCPPFAGWSMLCWWLRCSSFHCRFSFLSYGLLWWFCYSVLFALFRWCWHGSRDACMNWARVYLRNAPVHALGPGLDQDEAWGSPEAGWQVGEGIWRLLRWCHVEGRLHCATGRVVHWHQVPAFPQVRRPRSVYPWGCVLLREEGQVHPEAPRQEPQEQGSNFRFIFVKDRIHRFEWYYRCVKFLPASLKYISATALVGTCGRSSKECDPNVSVRRIEPSFRRGGVVPFRESLPCGIRSF